MKRPLVALLLLSVLLSGCGLVQQAPAVDEAGTNKVVKLVASDQPQTLETLALLKTELEKQGYTLDHVIINDIIQPNKMVEEGVVDVNMFQHEAYMKQWNEDHGTHIVPAFYTTFTPAGLFSRKWTSIKDLPDGAKIGLPVDPANNGRSLLMLQEQGLLKVKPGVDVVKLSTRDVTENPKKLQFIEVDQQMLLRTLDDVDLGFLFGSTAIQNGLTLSQDALVIESEANNPYVGIFGTRPSLLGSPKIEALKKAYQTDAMKDMFRKRFAQDPSVLVFKW